MRGKPSLSVAMRPHDFGVHTPMDFQHSSVGIKSNRSFFSRKVTISMNSAMPFSVDTAGMWDNFVCWLDDSLGISGKEDKRHENTSRAHRHSKHNTEMRNKVYRWLLSQPDEVEPLDEDEGFTLSDEELAIYDQLMKRNAEATEMNPLKKVLQWLDELTTTQEEETEDEHMAALRRCDSVEDFLNERFRHDQEDEQDIPDVNVTDYDELMDPYLDESASMRFCSQWQCSMESAEELDEVKSDPSNEADVDPSTKTRRKSSTKDPLKKLGQYLIPAKTVYRQRAHSDADSTEDHVLSANTERKDRSYSEGDVHKRKESLPRLGRIKKRLEKRKPSEKRQNTGNIDELDEITELDDKHKKLMRKRLVKLIVTRAKFTLNGY